LQQAATTRELARQQAAEAQARVAAERETQRRLLADLGADVSALQTDLTRLAARVSAALDAIASASSDAMPQPPPASESDAAEAAAQATPSPAVPRPELAREPIAPRADGADAVPIPTRTEPAQGDASPVTVLVHGVPRAAAALSLQRHLAALPHVEAVEAREYAAGILRLQVLARRPLAVADLDGWEAGAGLTPVHVLDDVFEVRLPGATGF